MTEVNCDLISLAQKINSCLSLKHFNPLFFTTNSLLVMKEINEIISRVKEPDKLLMEIPNVFTLCDALVENPSCCDQSRESMSSVLSKFLFRCLKSFDKTNKEHKEKHEWAMISRIVCQKTKELSERNIPERESELERCEDIVQNLIDLCDLSEIRVWEPTIKSIGEFPTELRLRLCSRISEKLTRCSKETEEELSFTITEWMYLVCRPLVERDLLQLVSDCSHLVLPSSFLNKLQNSNLVRVCCRNKTLLHVCTEMLNSLLLRAWSSGVLKLFVNSFCKCTQRKENNTSILEQGLAIPTNLYGESVHPLLKHLQGFLIAREETMKAVHVKAISLELQKLEENGTAIQKERMCLLLVHHLDVCSRVIEFCLTCDKALITDCIEIISVYSSLEEAKQNHVKTAFPKVIECLRGLLHKVSLGIMDIRCAVMDASDVIHGALLGQLLIIFMLKAEQGLRHALDILQMAVGNNLAQHQLKALLTVHDSLNIQIDRWSASKQNQYRILLNSLSRGNETTELRSNELSAAVNYIVEKMS